MCGIAGVVDRAGRTPLPAHPVHRMLESIAHRGPDESHAAEAGRAVLGTARLAMVDKPTSHQPMADPTGRYLMAFNGEIYNHCELRAELAAHGVCFRTTGDTEVLLHALICWGVEGLGRLKGQFAVAFWDAEEQALLLARDRFGIVPLFWTVPAPGQLAFASEVKALRAGGFAAGLSLRDVVDTGTLWGLHPGRSAFTGVSSVAPGGYVLHRGDRQTSGHYWRFRYAEDRDAGTLPDQARRLAELLVTAVERRVPAYGDPAVLLSGGLDSSAVLALLRRGRSTSRINSYSIRFARAALDESRYQAVAADAFATCHSPITCDDDAVARTLVETIEHTELPLVRTAAASSIALAARIEQDGTRAVLSGEGADELLCGYDLFKLADLRDRWSREPRSERWPARLQEVMGHQRDLGRSVERAFYEQGLDRRDDPLFSHLNRWSAAFKITQYLAPDRRAGLSLEDVYAGVRSRLPEEYAAWSVVEQAQYLEVTYFLATSLLASQCDRPYMAHSIEARYPFLDEDVVDFALTLPEVSKLSELEEKRVLKRAVADAVPAAITDRVKQPYTAPEGDVFRCEPGRALVADHLSPEALSAYGIFDPARVGWLVRKLDRSATSFHDDLALLWILSTQVLAQRYGVDDSEGVCA